MRVPSLGLPGNVSPAFWGMVFVEGARGAYFGIWPLWMEHLGAGITVIGVLLGAISFLRMFFVGPSASLTDRFGTRNLLLVSRVTVIIAFTIALFATSWVHLIPAIVLLASGDVVYPLVQSYVLKNSTEDQGIRSFTMVLNVGSPIGLFLGPLIAGVAVWMFDMRAAFALSIMLSALSLLAMSRLDADRVVTRAAHSPRSSYRTALSQRPVLILLAMLGVMVIVLSLGTTLIPTFVEDVRGLSPASVAFLSALPALGTMISGLLVARSRRVQQQPFIGVMTGMLSVACALTLFHQFGHPAFLAVAFGLRGGMQAAWTMLIGLIGKTSRAVDRARSLAASEIIGGVLFAFGPMIAGLLYARRPELPFEVAIVLILLLIPIMFQLQKRLLRPTPAAIPASGQVGAGERASGRLTEVDHQPDAQPLAASADDLRASG